MTVLKRTGILMVMACFSGHIAISQVKDTAKISKFEKVNQKMEALFKNIPVPFGSYTRKPVFFLGWQNTISSIYRKKIPFLPLKK